jgi:hypothetical protein
MPADAPVQRALTFYKGFSFNEQVIVTDKVTNLVRNLTGYAPTLVIDPPAGASVTLSTGAGNGLVLTPTLGQIDIKVPDTMTAGWTFDSADYILRIDNGTPEGNEPLMYGAVIVRSVPT